MSEARVDKNNFKVFCNFLWSCIHAFEKMKKIVLKIICENIVYPFHIRDGKLKQYVKKLSDFFRKIQK